MKNRGWEERQRFEELDSEDEDDGQGVELDPGFRQKRFSSDELRFTGIDFSSRTRQGRRPNNDEDSEYSDDEHDDMGGEEERKGGMMQVALRDKEDYLVQSALERIRRAQMLGKRNVRLSQDEMNALDAYERKRQQSGSPTKSKDKKSGWSRPKQDDKRRSKERSSGTPPKTGEPARRRGRTADTPPVESTPPYPLLPYPDHGVAGASSSQPPLGYYAAPAIRPSGSSSRPSSRSASSQSLRQLPPQQYTPPLPAYPQAYQQPRYYSVPETLQAAPHSGSSPRTPPLSRPLPDDPNWAPRARSTSNLVPYPPDQYSYQVYAPPQAQMDPRYAMQGHRHISGPPDVRYPSMRPPLGHGDVYAGSTPDPHLRMQRRESGGERSSENDDDEDEDEDSGVQVEVVERPSGYETKVVPGASRSGRQRKGRR